MRWSTGSSVTPRALNRTNSWIQANQEGPRFQIFQYTLTKERYLPELRDVGRPGLRAWVLGSWVLGSWVLGCRGDQTASSSPGQDLSGLGFRV